MDAFADGMVARGPTLEPDREGWTGSLHVLRLPDPATLEDFVVREPFNVAGQFAEHAVWGFDDRLDRTMWDFPLPADEPRFLVVALGLPAPSPSPGLRERLILLGELTAVEDGTPAGVALAVQAPSRAAVVPLLSDGGFPVDAAERLEVHDWEFGGRR